jgi:hypothetical protein
MAFFLRTKRANVVTYLRPSVNAIKGTCYGKPGQELCLYPIIRGWFELRIPDEEGETHAEFVRWSDVTPITKYFLPVLKKRIKRMLKLKS